MLNNRPKISVFSTCKNGARFLQETIESVLNQSYTDYEHVLVDGGSTDGTIDILRKYKHLRWISEPDENPNEGFHKALAMTRGEYLMVSCISDGFLSRNWFQQCVDVLDNDPEVSLVYGLAQYMTEDGSLGKIAQSHLLEHKPPQKMDYLPFWLATFMVYSELTYCVRADVYKQCFPKSDSIEYFDRTNPFLKFIYNFNTMGYLPFFLPVVASFGRIHSGSQNNTLDEIIIKTRDMYNNNIIMYRNKILRGKKTHIFRDGASNVIKVIEPADLRFYRRKVLKYRLFQKNRGNYPDVLNLQFWKMVMKKKINKYKKNLLNFKEKN
ncbi:MAG: glycosyltransferase [bacterium]